MVFNCIYFRQQKTVRPKENMNFLIYPVIREALWLIDHDHYPFSYNYIMYDIDDRKGVCLNPDKKCEKAKGE